MAQTVVRIEALPEGALDAAAEFHSRHLQELRATLSTGVESLVVVLPGASSDQVGWRRASVQDLARAHAPSRVNFVAGGSDEGIAQAIAWLAAAPGVTGQLLQLD